MSIGSVICVRDGHNIVSLRTSDKMITLPPGVPSGPILAGVYVSLCSKCGLSLEEIQANEKKRTRSPRKAKEPSANQETA